MKFFQVIVLLAVMSLSLDCARKAGDEITYTSSTPFAGNWNGTGKITNADGTNETCEMNIEADQSATALNFKQVHYKCTSFEMTKSFSFTISSSELYDGKTGKKVGSYKSGSFKVEAQNSNNPGNQYEVLLTSDEVMAFSEVIVDPETPSLIRKLKAVLFKEEQTKTK